MLLILCLSVGVFLDSVCAQLHVIFLSTIVGGSGTILLDSNIALSIYANEASARMSSVIRPNRSFLLVRAINLYSVDIAIADVVRAGASRDEVRFRPALSLSIRARFLQLTSRHLGH